MNLEKFISETLISIKKGLRLANESLVEDGKVLGRDATATFLIGSQGCENISFDIAVMVGKGKNKKGGGEIKVMSIGVGGGLEKTETQQSVSRIKFNIQSSQITG